MFVFKHWVLDFIVKNKHFTSISRQVVPFLITMQYKFRAPDNIDMSAMTQEGANNGPMEIARRLSAPRMNADRGIVCAAFVAHDSHTIRVDTQWSYMEVNRWIAKSSNVKIASGSDIATNSKVGLDSLIGEGTLVLPNCSIKKSVIGKHCHIGENCKILNSVIMDHVNIESE
jgi:translation initiation factor eIF-2B subunit gamma